MLRELKPAEERWIERVGAPRAAPASSVFPNDAVAVIYKLARSAMTTSGKARTRQWKLRFERCSPQFIEPLMGWTGDEDTLTQVELTFPSAEAAVAYARRQGLNFIVRGANSSEPALQLSDTPPARKVNGPTVRSANQRCLEWVEWTVGPDIIRAGFGPGDPAADYASPKAVLTDAQLSPAQKRDVLLHWGLNAYQIELAPPRGEPQSEPSRLDEVIDALLDLDEMEGCTLPRRLSDANRELRAA